ncbi:MAG: hypothetical protein EU543_06115 [Promethearchaeota archaeon]|nr:MAG: hypothetical protein EU543_06115 [Candidatus Lokiarchaeota archaeon]
MMSYIEKKYLRKIYDTFDELTRIDEKLLELIEYRSINKADEIAKSLANLNKKINLILRQYYPEIKEMDEKLKIKSRLKFYYDLLDKLTDFIRNVENFRKLDDRYYQFLIDFIHEKEDLINNKYKGIATRELTSFYDKKSRDNLEKILESKLKLRDREYFTFGGLEQELKKISGVESLVIKSADPHHKEILDSAETIIIIKTQESFEKGDLYFVLNKLKRFLESKGYEVETTQNYIITNIKLFID